MKYPSRWIVDKKQTKTNRKDAVNRNPGSARIAFEIELTNSCNSECVICPRGKMKRPEGMMSEETFQRLISQVETLAPRWNVEGISLSGMGEPTLHPELPAFIRRIKSTIGVQTTITTNGLLLEGALASRLIEAEIDEIYISANGLDEYYKQINRGGDFETVRENVRWFVKAAAKRVHTVILAVENELNRNHVHSDEFVEFWKKEGVDHIEILKYRSWGGWLGGGAPHGTTAAPPEECLIFMPFQFITWNGDMLACCSDLAGEAVIGSINKVKLRTLLEKKLKLSNPRSKFERCSRCPDVFSSENMEFTPSESRGPMVEMP